MMNGRRILVVGPSWIGDMVMAQSLFKVLKQRHSDCVIDVLAPGWSGPLLERMPEVRRAIDMPVGHGEFNLGARWALGRTLARQYDQAIILPNSLKSALIPTFAGIEIRTGWRGEMRFWFINDIRLLDERRYPLMVQRFNALAFPDDYRKELPTPYPALRVDQARVPTLLASLGLNLARPVLALCPGAEFGPAKRWPESYYAQVAEHFIAGGGQVWLFGSAKDRPVTEALEGGVLEGGEHCRNLAGITELVDAVDLLAQATAVVSNDSGLMHVAAALARPLVVVYGSTSPAFTPPLADAVRTLSIPVDCGPCFQRECPKLHLKCLQELPPERVIAALDELLGATPGDPLIAVDETAE